MEWATQKSGWTQPAANGSDPVDIMEPLAVPDKSSNVDEAGNAHVDSPETSKKNYDWV